MSGELKAVVTVTEMARMVGLSRARFYQHVQSGAFPRPCYMKGRPVYTADLQAQVLEVKRRNLGINGEPVVFYGRRKPAVPSRKKRANEPAPTSKDIPALLDGLNALGLTTATAAQVLAVTEELYPKGTEGMEQGEVLRAVFLELRRRHAGGKGSSS
jgi:predicted DNA-binding transcriptional regulator AlpA